MQKPIIVFDEIHKYSKWKIFLKGFFDLYKGKVHIIVTGSAKLDVYESGGESLMGRYFPYRVHPLSIAECRRKVPSDTEISPPQRIEENDFEILWKYGGYPEPFLKRNDKFYTKWKSTRYKQLFEEDIRDLTHIHEVAQLELLAQLYSFGFKLQLDSHKFMPDARRKSAVNLLVYKDLQRSRWYEIVAIKL